jgi:hypothetical protein
MVFGLRDKVMIGVGLTFLLLNLTLLPIVFTGAVPDAVNEKFETYPLDAACGEDGDCSTVEADWSTSTAQRDYYAWDVTNLADVMDTGATPTYQKMGPFTYDITSTKTLIEHDGDAGELTYNLVKSFDCSADSVMPCDTEITQLNIQFRPQIIGATGTAFNGIMDLTKIGFASAVMNQDLNTTQAGIATSKYITSVTNSIAGGYGYANYGAAALGTAEGMGKVCVIMCNIADGNPLPAPDWSEGIDSALYSTTHPLDSEYNISMRDPSGPVAFMGMGAPEFLVSTIIADPANSTTVYRATAYGYMATMMIDTDGDDIVDTEVPDYPQTLMRDWCLYVLTGSEFQENGGGSDFTDSEDIGERLDHLLDVDFSNVDNLNLMLNGDGSDTPLGLLAENADGTGFGLATFLGMDATTAMSTFGLDQTQYDAIFTWANGWATSSTSMQLALIGGTGTVNAGQFVNTTFGAEDPINGGYLERSLNLGGLWETMYALPAVNLTPEQSANVLYGPLGLTTRTGANLFLYGELVGNTPPVDLATLEPASPVAWNTDTIAAAYDIDTNAASAMRTLVTGPIFENFVPDYLMDKFGTTPYLTQSVNNWLYGWHDPVSAYLESGDAEDMSVGWASLEANATYYGSDGVPNGDGTNYTICTGENSACDRGEMIEQDGSTQLSWRNDVMLAATFGIITPEELSGATGGFIVGEGDKVDVSGYAIADLDCSGTSSVKNIPVDVCTASVDPTSRSIQAKLLKTFTLLDATPSALPVYLGSDIEVKSEQLSGLIIAGESTTTFYLDTRDGNDMVTPPTMDDMVPVFQIESASMIGDDDAEQMESAIVQNQNYFTFWSNFDTGLDFIPLFLWIFGISLLICPAILRLFD